MHLERNRHNDGALCVVALLQYALEMIAHSNSMPSGATFGIQRLFNPSPGTTERYRPGLVALLVVQQSCGCVKGKLMVGRDRLHTTFIGTRSQKVLS